MTVDNGEFWVNSDGGVIFLDGSLIVADVRFDYDLDTVRANANLIAAAPDLLAALQELLEHEPEEMIGVWYNARTAVAKATGKD